MSHFTVAVILKDIDDLQETLAPFDENVEVPQYIKYTKEQAIENVRKDIEDYKNGIYATYLADKESYKRKHSNKEHLNYLENEFPKRLNWTDEECYQEAIRWCNQENIDADGNILSTYNPNAKWDYWSLLEDEDSNMPKGYCLLKDFPKDLNQERYQHALRQWEITVEGKPLNPGEKQELFFNAEYYLKLYKDKENYARIASIPHFWAFVLDDVWYEKGKMGWWCLNDATSKSINLYLEKWKNVLENPDLQNRYIAIVDCHI